MSKQECSCGTGNYCHIHGKYGKTKPNIVVTDDSAQFDTRHIMEYERMTGGQRCGGGIRVVRKPLGGSY